MNEKQLTSIITEVVKKYMYDAIYVPVGVSNRHIHVSREDLDILYGKGYELTKLKDLKQPGQYAAVETVELISQKGIMKKVRILGPVRPKTQVEISISDSFALGIKAPIRESGNIAGTLGLLVKGPKGDVELGEGVIAAYRHIHMKKSYADAYGFKDGDLVSVETEGIRSAIFKNVLLRVSDNYALELHLDLDEANGAGIKNGDLLKIIRA